MVGGIFCKGMSQIVWKIPPKNNGESSLKVQGAKVWKELPNEAKRINLITGRKYEMRRTINLRSKYKSL